MAFCKTQIKKTNIGLFQLFSKRNVYVVVMIHFCITTARLVALHITISLFENPPSPLSQGRMDSNHATKICDLQTGTSTARQQLSRVHPNNTSAETPLPKSSTFEINFRIFQFKV